MSSEGPKQANVQGSGIITGDINLSFNSIKEKSSKECYGCRSIVDYQDIGGSFIYLKDGRKFLFCDWCMMCLDDYYEKVKEYL
tara:strand:+ start:806 stop:1054 length:249 start_codon:yes stop_codon:yes gene_type:complete